MARAVIVHVDSPGGTTAGSEQLFDSLSRLREKKPLVVVVDSMAASGGYITALAADHIVAQQTSLVGSIGVLFQYPNVTDLLGKIGVKVEAVKSTPLKAAPDGYRADQPRGDARRSIRSSRTPMPGSKAWCRTAGISPTTELAAVDDGRVFTGHQGLDLKLIDELGDERTALAWLAKEKNVDAKLPVRDYRAAEPFQRPAVPARRGGGRPRCGGARRAGPAPRRLGRRRRGGAFQS